MIKNKIKISLPRLKRHAEELFSFYLSYDKPCGKLRLGQNCIKFISDKSNSVAMFLRIQTDIGSKCHVRTTCLLKCRSKQPI